MKFSPLLFGFFVLLFTNCATPERSASYSYSDSDMFVEHYSNKTQGKFGFSNNVEVKRKILFSAHLHLTVRNTDSANVQLAEIA